MLVALMQSNAEKRDAAAKIRNNKKDEEFSSSFNHWLSFSTIAFIAFSQALFCESEMAL